MARRRERRHQHEGHGNHERWLITYADMITLLMVLFIVLFAVSQVDQKRFDQLKEGMAAGFGNNPSPFQGTDQVLAAAGAHALEPIRPRIEDEVRATISAEVNPDGPAEREDETTTPDDARARAEAEVARLEALRKRIAQALARRGYRGDVAMAIDHRGLRVSLVSRHIVFRANLADLSPRGRSVLDVLAPVLRSLPNQIEIAGHTNQVPVKPKYYPTDWELSAARAVTVLRYLHEQRGLSVHNMSATAYGHEQPLVDPDRPGSQAMNKRVDVVVLSGASDEVRSLFASVLQEGRAP